MVPDVQVRRLLGFSFSSTASLQLVRQLPVVEAALSMLAADAELANLWSYCKGPPIVLGWWQAEDSSALSSDLLDDIGTPPVAWTRTVTAAMLMNRAMPIFIR